MMTLLLSGLKHSLNSRNILQGFGLVFLASCLAGAQFFLIKKAFETDPGLLVYYARQIIEGFPDWRDYQSRVLAPYSMEGLHKLTGWEFEMCYDIVAFFFLFVFFLILLLVARSLWKSTPAMVGIAVAAGFLNAMLMQRPLLCPWDYVNLILFTILVWAILKEKSLWYIFIPLAIGIFNHEIIMIAAAWLVLDAIARFRKEGAWRPQILLNFQRRQFSMGLIVLIGGFFIIESLRDALLIHPVIQGERELIGTTRLSVDAVMLKDNLHALVTSFCHDAASQQYLLNHFGSKYVIIFNPLIFGIFAISIRGFLSRNRVISRISFLHLILWVFYLIFGNFYEVRIWLVFVPFLVLVPPLLFSKNSTS